MMGGMVALWLDSAPDSGLSNPGSSPGQDTVCRVIGNTLYVIEPLSTQVYKWVLAK